MEDEKSPESDLNSGPLIAKKISPKKKKFIRNYILNGGNGTQAAIDAGYAEGGAKNVACRALKEPHIAAAVQSIAVNSQSLTDDYVIDKIIRWLDSDEPAPSLKAAELLTKIRKMGEAKQVDDSEKLREFLTR